MARIVIVGASEASRAQLTRLLASSGHGVFRACATDGELRRTLSECEDGVVVFSGGALGSLAEDISSDFPGAFQLLLIARPETLSACESREVFKLAYPCSASAVIGAVEMLVQLHDMRLPRRAGPDRALVEQAKALLMRRDGIDEPEAHRRIQQYAMRHNMKMTDCAAMLLRNSEGTEG